MTNDFDLKGAVCIVTGALGLIGREHVRALAEAGGAVVVLDREADKSQEFARQVASETGAQCLGLGCDIVSKAELERARDAILARFGKIDVLVNNAAINDMFENPLAAAEQSKFENYPLELFERMLSVNVTGMFLCAQVFGSVMAKNKKGSIINVSSTYGMVGPDQSLYINKQGEQTFYKSPGYPTTKAAVIGFTKYLAAYWGSQGVRVNTLSPGGVENGQSADFIEKYSSKTPLGRMARSSDYRGALIYLSSGASSYVTGANLVVDGGWTAW